jgi:hypothetical protein
MHSACQRRAKQSLGHPIFVNLVCDLISIAYKESGQPILAAFQGLSSPKQREWKPASKG